MVYVAHCPSPIIQVFTVVWKLYEILEIIKPLWLRYITQLGYIDCHCCFSVIALVKIVS